MDKATLKKMTSSTNEHYNTPKVIIDPIVKRFGQIALDPCSNSTSIVGAKVEWMGPLVDGNDGLILPWHKGTTFVNPPYGRKIKAWANKCKAEAAKGAEIFMLGPARVDTKYFQEIIVPSANCILFLKGRLTFGGAKDPAVFPSFLAYWGPRTLDFKIAFIGCGFFLG